MPNQLKCDRILCLTILGLMFFGLVMVFSATTGSADGSLRFVFKQAISAGIGLRSNACSSCLSTITNWESSGSVYFRCGRDDRVVVCCPLRQRNGEHSPLLEDLGFLDPALGVRQARRRSLPCLLPHQESRIEILDWRTLGAAGFVVASALCADLRRTRSRARRLLVLVIAGAILWVAGVKPSYFVIGAACSGCSPAGRRRGDRTVSSRADHDISSSGAGPAGGWLSDPTVTDRRRYGGLHRARA